MRNLNWKIYGLLLISFITTGQAATIAAFLQTALHHFRRRHKK